MGQPVQVGVPDLDIRVIGLHEGKGGRGHIFGPAQPGLDQVATKMGFACADRAVQKQRVTRREEGRKALRQTGGGLFIGKGQFNCAGL